MCFIPQTQTAQANGSGWRGRGQRWGVGLDQGVGRRWERSSQPAFASPAFGMEQGCGQMSTSGKNINRGPSPHRFYYSRRFHMCSFDPHSDVMTPGNMGYVFRKGTARPGLQNVLKITWQRGTIQTTGPAASFGEAGLTSLEEVAGPGLKGADEYKVRVRLRVSVLVQVSTA